MGKVEKVLVCNGCSQRFTQRQNLHRHKQKYLKKVVVSCIVRKKVSLRTDALKRHKYTSKIRQKTFCSLCNKHFPTPYNYKRHLKQKHSKNDKKYKCSTCGKEYLHENFFKSHICDGSTQQSIVKDKKSLKYQFNKEIPTNMDGVVSFSLINNYFGKNMDDFGQVSIIHYLFLSPISTD